VGIDSIRSIPNLMESLVSQEWASIQRRLRLWSTPPINQISLVGLEGFLCSPSRLDIGKSGRKSLSGFLDSIRGRHDGYYPRFGFAIRALRCRVFRLCCPI